MVEPPRPSWTWQRRLFSICFAIFAFEIGLFLVVFPWMDDSWMLNSLGLYPGLANIWDDGYFRGALTGLGFINIYIATLEIFRMIRRPR
jgi:hypothetical protein